MVLTRSGQRRRLVERAIEEVEGVPSTALLRREVEGVPSDTLAPPAPLPAPARRSMSAPPLTTETRLERVVARLETHLDEQGDSATCRENCWRVIGWALVCICVLTLVFAHTVVTKEDARMADEAGACPNGVPASEDLAALCQRGKSYTADDRHVQCIIAITRFYARIGTWIFELYKSAVGSLALLRLFDSGARYLLSFV